MKKRFHIGTMLLLAITLLISCSERPGSDAGEKILRLAFVPKLRDNPVFGYAKIAAEHRAHELGSIEIIWRAPNEPNAVHSGASYIYGVSTFTESGPFGYFHMGVSEY